MTTLAPANNDTPALNLRGHADGFALEWMGEPIDIFPDFEGASEGFRLAKRANAMLAETLARKAA